MRIPSGVTDQYIYFVAVDATDFTTRETGLSSFTVYRSRNGAAAAAMTTPTVNETDTTNMPGVYELLLDEDTTLDAGDDTQEMAFHITHAGMAPVTRTVEIYRPDTTLGNTLDVTSTGAGGIDWANVENQATTVDLSTSNIANVDQVLGNVVGNVAAVTGSVGSVTGAVGSVTAEVSADVTKISGSATAADNLEASTLGVIPGTAQTGTLSTTVMTSDLTGYVNDELIGRVVVWTGGTAAGQASEITDYASASGTVTYNAITTAPVNNDTFVIV